MMNPLDASHFDKRITKAKQARIRATALFVLLMAALSMFSGCTQLSPGQRYKIVNDSYVTTVEAVTALSQGGFIDVDTLRQFDAARREADVLLNLYEAAIREGRPFDDIETLDQLIDDMIRLQLQVEQGDSTDDGNLGSLDDYLGLDEDGGRHCSGNQNGDRAGPRFDDCGAGRLPRLAQQRQHEFRGRAGAAHWRVMPTTQPEEPTT